MKKIYSLLILLSALLALNAQIPIPAPPVACDPNTCITSANIDVCPPTSNTVVGSHLDGAYNRGNSGNNLGPNAVWRFRNMANAGGLLSTLKLPLTLFLMLHCILLVIMLRLTRLVLQLLVFLIHEMDLM